jgi:hypothetical protein
MICAINIYLLTCVACQVSTRSDVCTDRPCLAARACRLNPMQLTPLALRDEPGDDQEPPTYRYIQQPGDKQYRHAWPLYAATTTHRHHVNSTTTRRSPKAQLHRPRTSLPSSIALHTTPNQSPFPFSSRLSWSTQFSCSSRLTSARKQVTDSRDESRTQNRPSAQRQSTGRVISVDHVLQYASEIPSAQRRMAPGARPSQHTRTPSGRHPLNPKLGGRMPEQPTLTPRGTPVSAAHIPTRSSKVSEKLVLLPETTEEDEESDGDDDDEEEDARPPDDEELKRRKARKSRKSRAERLPKSQRTAEAQLARVTAYCTAQSYKAEVYGDLCEGSAWS